MSLERYNKIKELLDNNNCKLLSSYQDYLNCKDKVKKIDIISSCGHESKNINGGNLLSRKSGLICRNCIYENFKKNNKLNGGNLIDTFKLESDSIKNISLNLKNILLKKTDEFCLSDFAIKPVNIKEDNWLPIQLKSTNTKNSCSFRFKKNYYKNNIIILHSFYYNRFWIIDNEEVKNLTKIEISIQNSKYDKFEVKISDIDKKLEEFYFKFKNYHSNFENLNIPILKTQQTEKKHRINRESKINFLKFTYPEINQQVYDFTINNLKIQEKTAYKIKSSNTNCVTIKKNGGTVNNKATQICYAKGDNDFYWINLPNFDYFFVIPEKILIEKDVIARPNNKKGSITIPHNLTEKHWLFEHRFSYLEPDRPKLLKLFNL